MACKVRQMCCWDAGAVCAMTAGDGVAGRGAAYCCGSALAICPWSRAKYRSACLMLKSKSPAAVRVGAAPAAGAVVLGTKMTYLLALARLRWPCPYESPYPS
jgi:hypothetical protein